LRHYRLALSKLATILRLIVRGRNRMAAVESLRTHLIEELADLLDAETQLTKALPKMARAATTKPLKAAFQSHLVQTRGHIRRLNKAMRELGQRPRRKTCEGMASLISEGEDVMNKTPEGALRDAVMITAAQKVEHYEMASYGTARTYAEVLGEPAVARLLQQNLKEEKAADGKLTMLAERSVNEEAAEEWQSQEEDEGLVERSTKWVGDTMSSTRRQIAGGARRAAASLGLASERSSRRRAARKRGARRRSRSSSHRKHR
jgi:ferritin-like metal-binding protein YciE